MSLVAVVVMIWLHFLTFYVGHFPFCPLPCFFCSIKLSSFLLRAVVSGSIRGTSQDDYLLYHINFGLNVEQWGNEISSFAWHQRVKETNYNKNITESG